MIFSSKTDNDYGVFRCQKVKNHKNRKECKISALENTIFENVHIEFQRALFLAYCFVKKMTYEETIIQTSVIKICNVVTSTATVTDWFTYCREILTHDNMPGEIEKIQSLSLNIY